MSLTFSISGTGTGAVKAVEDLNKAIEKSEKGFALTAREAKKLEDAAGRVVKANEQPLERYNRRLDETAKLVTAGKLSHEQAAMAAQRYGVQLETAGKRGEQAFGAAALSRVTSFFGGFVAGALSINTVIGALKEMDQVAKAAADRVRDALGSAGEMAQFADSPEDLKALASQVADIRRRGIQPDRNLAQELVMMMRGAGLDAVDQETILSLAERGLIDPKNINMVAENARKFQRAFKLPSMDAVMDLSQEVGRATYGANLSQSVAAMLGTATGAGQQGIGVFENAAALVTIEQKIKSIGMAETALASLYAAAQKKGIAGQTIEELLANIDAATAGGTSIYKVLGRGEAVTAYRSLKDSFGVFQNLRGEFATADDRDVASVAAGFNATRPDVSAALARRAAEGSLAAREEELHGERRNLLEMVRARYRERSPDPSFLKWIQDSALGFSDLLGTGNLTLRGALDLERLGPDHTNQFRQQGRDILDASEERRIEQYLQRIADSNEEMLRREPTRSNPGRPE